MTDHDTAAIELTLTVLTDDVAAAMRAHEQLSRMSFGFGLDRMEAEVTVSRLDHAEAEDDEPAEQQEG